MEIIPNQEDGSFTHSDYEIGDILNKFFTSVPTKEPGTETPILHDRSIGCILQNVDLTHQDVWNQLNWLKTHA